MDSLPRSSRNGIGTLQENSLHADLIAWYSQPGDEHEIRREGYVIDIVRGQQLIEVQTRNFSSLKTKLARLVESHPVRLIYPIAREKWVVRQEEDTERVISRRKSPRRGQIEHLFRELVRIPGLIEHPNFTLEVVFIREEEVQVDDGRGSWRRKGRSIRDRRLLEVVDTSLFTGKKDFLALLPAGLPPEFTARELARRMSQPVYIAQKMVYCLRQMEALQITGRRGKSYVYSEVEHV